MDCIVHDVSKSRTRLSDFHFASSFQSNLGSYPTDCSKPFRYLLTKLPKSKFNESFDLWLTLECFKGPLEHPKERY